MTENTFTQTPTTAWCPGCGNFNIRDTLTAVLNDLTLTPKEVLLVGGIGQAAKTNQYINANGFSGLHGRALPAAIGAKIANPHLTVIVNTGDGDSYGEGGNHFLHNIRRNPDLTHFIHDNQIYGLTTGQVSPTSEPCPPGSSAGFCNRSTPLRPLHLALAVGATFVARSFSGDREHLAEVMKAAILHKGYAVVDILQPCPSFNKINTFAWYQERVFRLENHDPKDKDQALSISQQWGEQIPLGIFYQVEQPTYHQRNPLLASGVNLSTLEKTNHSKRLLQTFV